MLWIVVGVVVLVGLGIAISVQQRHETDLTVTLLPLCGDRLTLAISQDGQKLAPIGNYVGVIEAIDPASRWVSFEWIDWLDDPQLGPLPELLASNGVIADRIRWVQVDGGSRIDLR